MKKIGVVFILLSMLAGIIFAGCKKECKHKIVVDESVPATCTMNGLTEGKHCSLCNKVIVEQEVIVATGHKEIDIPEVAPRCTVDGATKGSKCAVCKIIFKTPEKISALGHTTGLGKCTRCNGVCRDLVPTAKAIDAEYVKGLEHFQKMMDYLKKAMNSTRYNGTLSAVVNLSFAGNCFGEAANLCGDYPEFAAVKKDFLMIDKLTSEAFSGTVSHYGDSRDLDTLRTILDTWNSLTPYLKSSADAVDSWSQYY